MPTVCTRDRGKRTEGLQICALAPQLPYEEVAQIFQQGTETSKGGEFPKRAQEAAGQSPAPGVQPLSSSLPSASPERSNCRLRRLTSCMSHKMLIFNMFH